MNLLDNTALRIGSACVGALLFTATLATAQTLHLPTVSIGTLLHDHPGAIDPILDLDGELLWSRAVDVDLELLDRLSPAGGDVIDVELSATHRYRAVFESSSPNDLGGIDWIGRLDGLPNSRFILSRVGEWVAATFEPHDGTPEILNLMPGPTAHFVRAHPSDVIRCGVDDHVTQLPTQPDMLSGAACCHEDPAVYKLLFVFTPQAILQVGPGISSVVGLTLATFNLDLQSTAASGFVQQGVLAAPLIPWSHLEPCDEMDGSLSALRTDPSIAIYRDTYEADLVVGLIADTGSACRGSVAGVAYIGDGVRDSTGFGVNRITIAAQVVPHEIGHNLGCRHEGDCSGSNNKAWSATCGGQTSRTRMWATLGSSVVGFFSNPNFHPTSCSRPLGDATCADNVAQISRTRQGIANYRGGHKASSRSTPNGAGSYPGTNGAPSLTAHSQPIAGQVMTMRCTNSRGSSTQGGMFIGFRPDSLPTPFGGVLVLAPELVVSFSLSATLGDMVLRIPADPVLCGTEWRAQAVIIDPGASAGLAFSNGLIFNVGR